MKIPVYNPQVEPTASGLPSGGAPGLAGGAVPDLSAIPRAMAQYQEHAHRIQQKTEEDDARYWLGLQSSAFRKESAEYVMKQSQSVVDGGAGFTAGVDAYLETRARQIRESAPNKFAGELWDVESSNLRAQTFGHSLQIEAAESSRYKQKAVGETVMNNAAFLYQNGHIASFGSDPKTSQFKLLRDQSLDMIQALPIAGAQKDSIVKGMDNELAQSYLFNQLNNAPRSLLDSLKNGNTLKYLTGVGITPDQNMLQSFLNMAENKIRSEDAQSKDDITRWMKNNIDSVSLNGKEFNPPMDVPVMKELVGQTTWKNYEDNIAVAWGVRKGMAAILENPSPSNVQNILETAKSSAQGLESSRYKDIYDGLVNAWTAYKNVLVNDGHTLAMQSLEGADVQMMVNGELHTNDPVARAAYSFQYQKTAGLPEEAINILSKEEAKNHVTNLMKSTPEEAQHYLQSMKDTYGPFYDKAYRQLSQAGLPTGYKLTLWGMETPVGDILTNVSRKAVKELEEASGLPPPDLNAIQQDVKSSLRPFVNTIMFGDSAGTRTEYAQAMYQEVYKVVLSRMATGESRASAVKSTIKALITDRYYIKDSYYIPKTLTETYVGGKVRQEVVSDSIVEKKLKSSLAQLEKFNPTNEHIFQSSLNGYDNKEILLKAIREDGYWLNNEDGTGAYRALTVSGIKGVPVLNKKGERFEFKWVDLNREGPSVSGKINRGKN